MDEGDWTQLLRSMRTESQLRTLQVSKRVWHGIRYGATVATIVGLFLIFYLATNRSSEWHIAPDRLGIFKVIALYYLFSTAIGALVAVCAPILHTLAGRMVLTIPIGIGCYGLIGMVTKTGYGQLPVNGFSLTAAGALGFVFGESLYLSYRRQRRNRHH